MLRDIRRILESGFDLAEQEAARLHMKLLTLIMLAFLLTLMMWGINALGYKEVNIIFFFLGGLYIMAQFTKPGLVVVAAGAGTVAAALNDRDKSQGAITGLKTLYLIAVGALFGFWVLCGLLSTWSFKEQPVSFFYVMMGVLMITVTTQLYKMKSGIEAKIIIGYSVIVILVAFWQTIPTTARPDLTSVSTSTKWLIGESKPSNQGPDTVVFEFKDSVEGREVTQIMSLNTTAIVVRSTPTLKDERLWACSKIIDPRKTLEPVFLKSVPGGDGRLVSHHKLSQHGKSVIEDAGAPFIKVTFVLTREKSFGASPCSTSS